MGSLFFIPHTPPLSVLSIPTLAALAASAA